MRDSFWLPPSDTSTAPRPFWCTYVRQNYTFSAFAAAARVLDVGCGLDAQLEQVEKGGCRVAGFDLDPNSLAFTVVQARSDGTAACKIILSNTRSDTSGSALPASSGMLYQSRSRLDRDYRRVSLRMIKDTLPPSFLGLSVFIDQTLRANRPSLTTAWK